MSPLWSAKRTRNTSAARRPALLRLELLEARDLLVAGVLGASPPSAPSHEPSGMMAGPHDAAVGHSAPSGAGMNAPQETLSQQRPNDGRADISPGGWHPVTARFGLESDHRDLAVIPLTSEGFTAARDPADDVRAPRGQRGAGDAPSDPEHRPVSAGNNDVTAVLTGSGQLAEAAALSSGPSQPADVRAAPAVSLSPGPAGVVTASALRGIASALLASGGGRADARPAQVAAAVFSLGWVADTAMAAHVGTPGSASVPGGPTKPDGSPEVVPVPWPAGLPWVAEVLPPGGVLAASESLLALQQLFPLTGGEEHYATPMWTRVLRSPWLPAAAVTLVALEVLRRHARAVHESSAEFPGITGPRGL